MMTCEVVGRIENEVLLRREKTKVPMKRNSGATILAENRGKGRGVERDWRRIFHAHIKGAGKVTRELSIYIVTN